MITRRQGAVEALERRYPSLAFMLNLKWEVQNTQLPQEESPEIAWATLSSVQVLYIYGLGGGAIYSRLRSWLKEGGCATRKLVFLEERLDALELLVCSPYGAALLDDPQVDLQFNLQAPRLKPFLQECAQRFPCERIELLPQPSYKKHYLGRFYRMRLLLLRATTVAHALEMEDRHYHLFFNHFIENFARLPTSFLGNRLSFNKVPAIVCGAGPSLTTYRDRLHAFEDRALILAGGSTLTALSVAGVNPHLGVAIDPNLEEYFRFKSSSCFETPLLYVNRLLPAVFSTCNGPHGYLRTLTGGGAEHYLEEQLGVTPPSLQEGFDIEAMSVTTTCIQLAYSMGCDPVILVGVDLAYLDGHLYAEGVVEHNCAQGGGDQGAIPVSQVRFRRKSHQGKWVETATKWIMESESIARFAKRNRKKATLIEGSGASLGCPGLSYCPLEQIDLPQRYELRGELHRQICSAQLDRSMLTHKLKQVFSTWRNSLRRGKRLTVAALKELAGRQLGEELDTGMLVLLEEDLQEEVIYQSFLQASDRSAAGHHEREESFFGAACHNDLDLWKRKKARLDSLWSARDHLIDFYLTQLNSHCANSREETQARVS